MKSFKELQNDPINVAAKDVLLKTVAEGAKKNPVQELIDNNADRVGKTLIDGVGRETKDSYWLGTKSILGGRVDIGYAVNVKEVDALSKEKSISLMRYNGGNEKVDVVALPQEFVKNLKKVL